MSKVQRYLHARTPFGTIIHITDRVYNAEATVEARDGSIETYRLPFLIAHGVTLAESKTGTFKLLKALASEQPGG